MPSPPGGAYYPGKVRDPALVTNPGATTVGNIKMPTMLVNVKKAGGSARGGDRQDGARRRHCQRMHLGPDAHAGGNMDSNGNILAAMPFGLLTSTSAQRSRAPRARGRRSR